MKHIKYIGVMLFGFVFIMWGVYCGMVDLDGGNVINFYRAYQALMAIGTVICAGGLIGIWVTELIDYKKKKNKGEKDKENKDKE